MTISQAFEGRVALVTGAASGIGLACTERLMSEGATVVLWDIDQKRLTACQERLGERAIAQRVDVTNEDEVRAALEAAVAQTGKLDIVVNSAGIVGSSASVWEMPLDAWNKVLLLNLTATFIVCKAAVPYLLRNGYGRVVNMASIAGKEGNANQSAYSASKAGVIGLTKSLGKELAQRNITVNAIAPASVQSELLAQMPPEQMKMLQAKIPMGRPGTVQEIAALIRWLSSEESSFSTGAVFDASGGRATY
ncbi:MULTISPECIES: SDR family NAD(P)-dependent oxidoreductase [unclassified Caballeronia]|uniref:SDR family NAD(P)-dependent oxidoreductase n=1 Tax=unclassified Caballeronia TaxID=2646786 RepID=UPI002540D279|nr:MULTISPECIES: SDR family NAD(P)-dependent oxidoreductase [unclassified Caballeronia]